ncbi:hypothetical protein LL912_14025 [Niabella sp. CC-SYL272]|uniref:anti-sigma factor family protein n=1 Tax=Niabella agricola TaxID=2891571 RepID=UPI001F48A898|nr:hypothetical protein [Niabella agricola]MCF3109894.1 hypothetical protein [Niabella agricola]
MQGKINPTNYEAYFLLYVDNELNRDERAEVEAFLQQHPETQPLLEELLRTRQVADPEMVFPDKSKLFFGTASISDEALLSYLDKEAVPAAVAEALQHPSPELAKRLQAFEQTIAKPDLNIVFPDKARLYRRRSRLVSLKIWRIAAAAALVVMAVGAALWMQEQGKKATLADSQHPRHQDSVPGNDVARVPADDSVVAADTVPQPGKETAIAVYRASDRQEQENRADKKEQKQRRGVTATATSATSTPAVSGTSTPAVRNAGVVSQQDVAINKVEVTPPAVQKQDPSVQPVVAMTEEEKQPKPKKSLFKKLTQRIEERISGALTDGEGQVTIAGFAVNVK